MKKSALPPRWPWNDTLEMWTDILEKMPGGIPKAVIPTLRQNGDPPEDRTKPTREELKKDIGMVADTLCNLIEISVPFPSLGLDLDGCVDEAPIFFNMLSRYWPGDVFVITYRSDRANAEADLARFGIRYDELILVDSIDAKAKVIVEKGILVFFDDQPETLKDVPPTVNVMLVRNGGNFDFDEKLWLFSEKTGRMV